MAEDQKDQLEYWHDGPEGQEGHWKKFKPTDAGIKVPGIVHETSTLYMSDDLEADPGASVDSEYRPRGCYNVYVTGGALFPTSGSWNRM
jgi:choline dehydrogenase-like flavoprotein